MVALKNSGFTTCIDVQERAFHDVIASAGQAAHYRLEALIAPDWCAALMSTAYWHAMKNGPKESPVWPGVKQLGERPASHRAKGRILTTLSEHCFHPTGSPCLRRPV